METSTMPPIAIDLRAATLRPQLVQLWRGHAPFDAITRWLCELAHAHRAVLLDEASGDELGRFPIPKSPPPQGRGGELRGLDSGPLLLRVSLPRTRAVALLERPGVAGGFEDAARRLVGHLQPDLDIALASVRALEGLTLTPAMVAALLDAMIEPAALLRGDEVVYPNLAVRTRRLTADAWLPRARRHEVDPHGNPPLTIAVAQPGADAGAAPGLPLSELPPWLRAIGELVEQGLSDKEIAERTGKNLTTVKTAVQRVFRRLGVHSRQDLVRQRWMRENNRGGGG